MTTSASTDRDPQSPARRWRVDTTVLVVVAALTLVFQAAYVFLPVSTFPTVLRHDTYDAFAHFIYYQVAWHYPDYLSSFHETYAWVHFPFFYQWNVFVSRLVCRVVGDGCANAGLEVGWFLQAVLRVGALGLLLATYRRLFRSPWLAGAALLLCATSPRVFFATCIWNQNEYVFCFAAICLYVTIAAIQDGLTARRIAAAAFAAALGFHFKLTMLLPIGAMLLAFLGLPAQRASRARKAAAVAVVALALVAVNWSLLTTPEGRERIFWTGASFHPNDRLNRDELVAEYLTLSPGPIFHPEKIYVRVQPPAWTGLNTTATGMYLYLFELYDHFQGPARTWLNLLCVWTGTPLLALVLWRAGRALVGLLRPATLALDEAYCATLVAGAFVALFAFSLGLPMGCAPHPEYVLAAYPAAAVLLVRQMGALRSRALVGAIALVAGLHLLANLAMLLHTAQYKIASSCAVIPCPLRAYLPLLALLR